MAKRMSPKSRIAERDSVANSILEGLGTTAEEMRDENYGVKFQAPKFSNPIKQIGGAIKRFMDWDPHKKKPKPKPKPKGY